MNLTEMQQQSKGQGTALYIALIIILVGVGAFFLGRLSVLEQSQSGINIVGERVSASAIEAAKDIASTTAPQSDESEGAGGHVMAGGVVASKSGTKYHFPWCAGAGSIKEGNKIWFESSEAARKAGYTAASNCKGLQ